MASVNNSTETVTRYVGYWNSEGDGYAENEDGEMCIVYDHHECPNCGYEYEEEDINALHKFCPECGANLKYSFLEDVNNER